MAKKRKAEPLQLFECKICRCKPFSNHPSQIVRHEAGEKHKRLAELEDHRSTLESWGIKLVEDEKMKYVCTFCNTDMDHNLPKMMEHFECHHKATVEVSKIPIYEVSKVCILVFVHLFFIYLEYCI